MTRPLKKNIFHKKCIPYFYLVKQFYIFRIQIKKMGKGVHKMIILHARLTDAGDVECTCVGQNSTSALLTVNKKGRQRSMFTFVYGHNYNLPTIDKL